MQLQLKGKSNFKSTAKDVLITSQLRTALIINKKPKQETTLWRLLIKKFIFSVSQ